jgi:hypothetical protein
MANPRRYLIFASIPLLVFAAILVVKRVSSERQIHLAKERFHLLRADMDGKQVIATLGLSNRCSYLKGGGSKTQPWDTLDLGGGHYLYSVYSVSPKSEGVPRKWTLLSVSLDDTKWIPTNDSKIP